MWLVGKERWRDEVGSRPDHTGSCRLQTIKAHVLEQPQHWSKEGRCFWTSWEGSRENKLGHRVNSCESGWPSRLQCPKGPGQSKLGTTGRGHLNARRSSAEQNADPSRKRPAKSAPASGEGVGAGATQEKIPGRLTGPLWISGLTGEEKPKPGSR